MSLEITETIQIKIETRLIEDIRLEHPDFKNINATIITKLALIDYKNKFKAQNQKRLNDASK